MWTFVILHSLCVLCTHAPVFPLGLWQKSDLGRHVAAFWFHMSSETMVPPVTFLSLPLITVSSPYLCLCLMGSPCFDSIADVVQSHGGVFMDSSYPSSPVTGPLSRGQRRASEVSIASQVSGMADSYTATNIANSKCSQYQQASLSFSLSLPSTHTNTVLVTLPLSFFLFSIFLSFSDSPPSSSLSLSLSLSLHPVTLTLHTPCTPAGAVLVSQIDMNTPLLFLLLLSQT